MAAIGLFRGPAHLLEYANDEFAERARATHVPLIVGAPTRELFTLAPAVPPAMDRVYATGRVEHVSLPTGLVTIGPYLESGRRVGVWTRFVVAPALPGSSPARRPARPVEVG